MKLAETIEQGLKEALPQLRKTVLRKLPLAIAAIMEAQTANTQEIANRLPLDLDRLDMREQWLRRLLNSNQMVPNEIMEPFARQILRESSENGQVIQLSMDQTDIGHRFAILMISVRVGDRALPLVWQIEAGAANIGFSGQEVLLEKLLNWLPERAEVVLSADRFYPSEALFVWLKAYGWQYRLRLKRNYLVDLGAGDLLTTGNLAKGVQERYEADVALFDSAILTNLGILHEPGHKEAWIIAMECKPSRAKVLDYSARWSIEPMFADFKSRGFGLQQTHLECPDRLSRLMLMMALAMYWCVLVGRENAIKHPTPTEKKPSNKPIQNIGPLKKLTDLCFHGLNEGYAYYYAMHKTPSHCPIFSAL
jgi:hypothetical protein